MGSVNILRKKAWYYDDRTTPKDVPDELKDIVEEYYSQIAEAIAMADDELMEKFFSGSLTSIKFARGLRIGAHGDIRPVYCGSATQVTGIERLLDLIREYFPSYAEKGMIEALDSDGIPILMETNEQEAFTAQVFKTIIDRLSADFVV